MRVKDLTTTQRKQIEKLRFDRIVEKHEGPEQWSSFLKYYNPDFLDIGP